MNLAGYFGNTKGTGILATADSSGAVDAAIYATPEVVDDNTIAFIMADRLSHQNLQSNPKAAYMFIEQGNGYQGKRLYLTKIDEVENPEMSDDLRDESKKLDGYTEGQMFFRVQFRVDNVRPLVGEG